MVVFVEHASHGGGAADVPLGDVAVECARVFEHAGHVGGPRHIPPRQIVVEVAVVVEGVGDVGQCRHVPIGDWRVAFRGVASGDAVFVDCPDEFGLACRIEPCSEACVCVGGGTG